ncbi:MAG TPA: ABC transporter substrate-binding protein, partial [Beijerinckiaceae bacterium]|nr:ABC transporter substrate-binding protein [Beijerinckiaceae bacterium]
MIERRTSSPRRRLSRALLVAMVSAGAVAGQIDIAHSQTPSPLPVTVELGDVSLTKLPIIIAADNGIFERNGLKVDMFITPRAAEAVRSAGVIVPPENIRSGAIGDISVTGGSPMVVETTTIATVPHRVILATMDNIVRFHIISRADITRPEQLKGKRIGYTVRGALTDYSTLLYLQELHFDPVQDVAMYSNGSTVGNIEKNEVDAFAGDEISVAAAKKAGMNDLVDLSQYNWPMAGSGLMALSSWLPNNHEAAQRFVKSIVEAIALMKTDKAAASASLGKWFGMKDPAKVDAVYASAKYLPSKPYPSVEGLQMM